MDQEQRSELVDTIRLASRPALISALVAVVETEGRAQMDHVDDPDDEPLGWFADGMDTAANVIRAKLTRQAVG